MTDLRKAAELALEALEDVFDLEKKDVAAIQALRQALAQPEQEQKTPLKVLNLTVFTENRLRNGRVYDVETLQAMTNRDILAIPDMGKKALSEVLEALNVHAVNMSQERVDETAKREHEPVAWMWKDGTITNDPDRADGTWQPLYTAPPKREWVGLTEDEFEKILETHNQTTTFAVYLNIEAKLKEKNS